jgi:outer membrane immunogenic protein
MGSRNVNLRDLNGVFFESEHISQNVDIGLVRLNYRFGGPLIAKY